MFGISGSEAIVTIVMKLRDEASSQLGKLGASLQKNRQALRELAMGATTVGVAFIGMGAALKGIDNPLAQTASGILTIIGGILAFVGTAGMFISSIGKIINALKSLAVVQAVVKALSGPAGWVQLAAGLAIAAAATASVYALTRAVQNNQGVATPASKGTTSRGAGTTNYNINTAAVMGNQQQARQLSRDIQRYNREDVRLGR